MFPVFLTEENFPFLIRARHLSERVLKSGPGQRCPYPPEYFDVLVVQALTNRSIGYLATRNLDEAEQVLLLALRIQRWLNHPMHEDLLDPLMMLAEVYTEQDRLSEAEDTLLLTLGIAAKTDARIKEHERVLLKLITIYSGQNRRQLELEMRASLARLRGENDRSE